MGAVEPVGGLRIMVETGGCAGYKYVMGLVNEASPTTRSSSAMA